MAATAATAATVPLRGWGDAVKRGRAEWGYRPISGRAVRFSVGWSGPSAT
jgi:hypothetical protein